MAPQASVISAREGLRALACSVAGADRRIGSPMDEPSLRVLTETELSLRGRPLLRACLLNMALSLVSPALPPPRSGGGWKGRSPFPVGRGAEEAPGARSARLPVLHGLLGRLSRHWAVRAQY